MIPTRGQLEAQNQQWLHTSREAGSVPLEWKETEEGPRRTLSPQAAREWGAQVLATYARDNGQSLTTQQIYATAAGYQDQGGRNWGQLNPDQKRLSAVLTNSATAALQDEFQTEYALAEVAIETIRDGRITDEEVESMCSTAGAIAGAVVGQAFGIPAPIGAFVGGIIGGVVGGVVASIAGLESGPDWQQLARAQARAEAEQWRSWQRGVKDTCYANRTNYVDRVDYVIKELSQKLRKFERDLGGVQLNLVWSGEMLPEDTPFFSDIPSVPGPRKETWSRQTCSDVSGSRRCTTHTYEKYVCDQPGGCRIPNVGGQALTNRSEREIANALMFYGAQWRAQNNRYRWFCSNWPTLDVNTLAYQISAAGNEQMCNVYGTGFPTIGITEPVLCDFYKQTMREAAKPGLALEDLVPARLLTSQAIVKTAAVERARIDIAARWQGLATVGADVKRSAWAQGKRKTWWANNGMLLLGGGLLGYALWQARKEKRL